MRTSVLVLLGAAAAEAFTGAPALSGLRSGTSSLQMVQAAPPASGKPLCQAKVEALDINAKQWGITAEGSTGTQAPPADSGKPLCQAKIEALEVNMKQWGISADGAEASGTQAPPPATGKQLCKAKVEALEVNQKQWGIGAGAAPAAAAAEEIEPVVIEPGIDYIAKLEALSSKYIKKLEAVN